MRVWLITVGEPLPSDEENVRLLRTGIFAGFLTSSGHTVVWWTSDFDHSRKKHRFGCDMAVELNERCKIRLIHGPGYKKNISFRRVLNHVVVARKFRRLAPSEPKPDIILSSLPTLELSSAALEYARGRGVPVVLDVRDLWPGVILNSFPRGLKWLAGILLRGSARKTHRVLRDCTAIAGVSESYLNWGLNYAGRERSAHDSVFHLSYQKEDVSEEKKAAALRTLVARGVDPAKTICWFIGGFGRTYNLATVIDAAGRLESVGRTDLQFVLSGDGERGAEWRARASGLKNAVFTGWIDPPMIAALMGVADIGLAAYAEGAPQGLPNKLFEYMCAGLPILSSLKGEAEAFLSRHNCGLSYSSSDTEDFIRKLDILLTDRSRRDLMGSNGKRLFDEIFSADATYSRMTAYLEDLVRQNAVHRYGISENAR